MIIFSHFVWDGGGVCFCFCTYFVSFWQLFVRSFILFTHASWNMVDYFSVKNLILRNFHGINFVQLIKTCFVFLLFFYIAFTRELKKKNRKVAEGKKLKLTCTSSHRNAKFRWLRNGKVIRKSSEMSFKKKWVIFFLLFFFYSVLKIKFFFINLFFLFTWSDIPKLYSVTRDVTMCTTKKVYKRKKIN